MNNTGLPDFFLIGAMKSGTSSLHYYLDQQSGISMSSIKEPNYFSKPRTIFHKNLRWYKDLFPQNKDLKGESSTAYTKFPIITDVPERIARKIKTPRFIYLVRNPVERTYSHVQHEMIEGLIPYRSTIDDYIQPDRQNPYLAFSCYMMQLDQYLSIFPKQSFLVLRQDDLKNDPSGVVRRVFGFLGLKTSVNAEAFGKKRNVSRERTIITDRRSYKRDRKLEKFGLRAPGNADRKWRREFKSPVITENAKQNLIEYFRQDIDRLYEFTGEVLWPDLH